MKKEHSLVEILLYGIPYGDFNKKLDILFPNKIDDSQALINGEVNDTEKILDTIGYIICTAVQFEKDEELGTVVGSNISEVMMCIKKIIEKNFN